MAPIARIITVCGSGTEILDCDGVTVLETRLLSKSTASWSNKQVCHHR